MSIELPRIVRGFTAFVDGRGYAGRVDEAQLPKLTLKTEEHRDGGMDAPIELDMGMDKLEVTLTLAGYEPDTFRFGEVVPLTIRGSLDDGSGGPEQPVEITCRGLFKEIDDGSWKSGDKGQRKVTSVLRYYRYRQGGKVLAEIDPVAGIRTINGVDQLKERRRNLAIG